MRGTNARTKGTQQAEPTPPAPTHGFKLDWAILLYPASILGALAVLYVVNRSIEREMPVPVGREAAQRAVSTPDNSGQSASTTVETNDSAAASAVPLGQGLTPDEAAALQAAVENNLAPTSTAAGFESIGLDGLEGPARVVAMLRMAVQQKNHALIKQYLEELVAMGDEAVDSLNELVNMQGEAGLWAAEALARIGTPAATEALLDSLAQTEEGQFKEDLASRVAGIANHDSWPLLLDAMLATEDATVARAAGDSLAVMADTPVIDEIIARYANATTDAEIERLAQLVGNINCAQATSALLSLAGSVADPVQDSLQQAAIEALANIGDAQCVSYLLQRLEAATPGEGTSIYNAITQIDSSQAYAQLLYAAAGNKEVSAECGQTAAIEALANYPCEETSALLERIVAEGANEKVVTAASRTLDSIQKTPYAVTASAESLAKSEEMLPIASFTK